MSNQHIENLEIRNFKCFKQLSIANIGQVNLIGGKNNVGKTAFLEAVEIFVSSNKIHDVVNSISNILERRQNKFLEFDLINDITKKIELSSLSNNIKIWLNDSQSFSVKINEQNEENIPIFSWEDCIDFSPNISSDFSPKRNRLFKSSQQTSVTYISSSKMDEKDIAVLLGRIIDLNRDDFLNNSLSSFDNNIIEIKQVAVKQPFVVLKLKLKLKNKESLVLLSSLGEGVNRYIAILCAIWASKDGVLLIDEIENGIHYTNYKKLWEIIFKTSIEANCQIFITTHSKECITAFNDVQFEDKECNAQYFEFYKNLKTDLITASARDKEQLRYALTHESRIRGE